MREDIVYKSGWIGLRSVPRTAVSGCSWARRCQIMLVWKEVDVPNSMAQIPVPVARSRTRWGFEIGARFNLPSSIILNEWCWRSKKEQSVSMPIF